MREHEHTVSGQLCASIFIIANAGGSSGYVGAINVTVCRGGLL